MRIIKTARYTKLAEEEQLAGFGKVPSENIAPEMQTPEQPPVDEGINPLTGKTEAEWATLKNIKEVDRILQNIELGSGEATAGANGVRNAIGSIAPNPLIEENAKNKFISDIEAAYTNLNKVLTAADEYFQNKKIAIVQNLGPNESQSYHQYVESIHNAN